MKKQILEPKEQDDLKKVEATAIITKPFSKIPNVSDIFMREPFLEGARRSILSGYEDKNHVLSGHFDHPRCSPVRFTILKQSGKYRIVVWVINVFEYYEEVVDRIESRLNEYLKQFYNADKCFIYKQKQDEYSFGLIKEKRCYKIRSFFPFNQENYEVYLYNVNNYGDKEAKEKNKQLVKRCIISNIYGMGKGVNEGGYIDYDFKNKGEIIVDIYDDFKFKTRPYKEGFKDLKFIFIDKLTILANVYFPICFGIGRKTASGYGRIQEEIL